MLDPALLNLSGDARGGEHGFEVLQRGHEYDGESASARPWGDSFGDDGVGGRTHVGGSGREGDDSLWGGVGGF